MWGKSRRKALPKDFEQLLERGDLARLQAVFEKCEIDARGGYSKQTALAFDRCRGHVERRCRIFDELNLGRSASHRRDEHEP